jgi:hypothetical protein
MSSLTCYRYFPKAQMPVGWLWSHESWCLKLYHGCAMLSVMGNARDTQNMSFLQLSHGQCCRALSRALCSFILLHQLGKNECDRDGSIYRVHIWVLKELWVILGGNDQVHDHIGWLKCDHSPNLPGYSSMFYRMMQFCILGKDDPK